MIVLVSNVYTIAYYQFILCLDEKKNKIEKPINRCFKIRYQNKIKYCSYTTNNFNSINLRH